MPAPFAKWNTGTMPHACATIAGPSSAYSTKREAFSGIPDGTFVRVT
jgi:hypothetical protein